MKAQEAWLPYAFAGDLTALRGRRDVDTGSESLCGDSRTAGTNRTRSPRDRGARPPPPGASCPPGPSVGGLSVPLPVSRRQERREGARSWPARLAVPGGSGRAGWCRCPSQASVNSWRPGRITQGATQGALTSNLCIRQGTLRDLAALAFRLRCTGTFPECAGAGDGRVWGDGAPGPGHPHGSCPALTSDVHSVTVSGRPKCARGCVV